MFEKVQIAYDGRKRDFNLADLDLANPADPSDNELKEALVMALDDAGDISEYVVDRTSDTVLNVRPDATLA